MKTQKRKTLNKDCYIQSKLLTNFAAFLPMKKTLLITAVSLGTFAASQAQSKIRIQADRNVITTMVPFLTITPDTRSAALGDAGVAIFDPDANSVFWNAANLVNAKKKTGFSFSFAPWLRQLVDDVGFSYLSGYTKINDRSAAGMSFRYFSLGTINFTDNNGDPLGSFNPNEFSIDGCYGLKFNRRFSAGVNLRFTYSNLTGIRTINGSSTKPGMTGSGDINILYKTEIRVKGKNTPFQIGANIQNMGAKMTYTNKESRDFIPTNLKLGAGWAYDIDKYNKVNVLFDINKLLVPTRPIVDNSGNIISGRSNNVGVVQGMIQSFYDAPGGASEEFKEINYSFGTEYWYNNAFAARAGVYYEATSKGNRKYATMGLGIKYQKLNLDLGYLVPVSSYQSPLQNQIRISLLFDFGSTEKN